MTVAFPFVYRAGEPFIPKQPPSEGILVGPGTLFTGRGVELKGAIAVVPGYKPVWLWQMWDRGPHGEVTLERDVDGMGTARRLDDLLMSGTIKGADVSPADRKTLNITERDTLNADERGVVHNFLSSTGRMKSRPSI